MSDREDANSIGSAPGDGDELAPMWTADGHVDECTIHAWLDGAFEAPHAAAIDAHVSACDVCSANVAEARGLIAGASRMVRSLDVVPAGVVSQEDAARTASRIVAAAMAHAPSGQGADFGTHRGTRGNAASDDASSDDTSRPASRRAPRPWYLRTEWRAAAALVVVVGGGTYVWSRSPATLPLITAVNAERDTFDSAVASSSPTAANARSTAPTAEAPTMRAPADAAPADAAPTAAAVASASASASAQRVDTLDVSRASRPRADDNRPAPLRRAADQQAKVAAAVPPAADVASASGRSEATAMRAVASAEKRAAELAAPPAAPLSGKVAGVRIAEAVASPSQNMLRDSAARDSAARDLGARDAASRERVRERLIVGRVVSPQQQPLEGVAVSIVGTTIGVMTDARGEFVLRSLGDSALLQVRRLGFESARLLLRTPPSDTARTSVTLKASSQNLSAVTVTSAMQPLSERRQVGTALAGSPTPPPSVTSAAAPAAVPAARTTASGGVASGRSMQCWALQPSDPSMADIGSPLPRTVLMDGLSADLGSGRAVTSQWTNWPIEGRNTSIPFARDARGRYRGTAIGAGVQWTIELTRRGAAWEVLATRAASGVDQKAPALASRYIMTTAADRVCKE